MDQKVGNYRTNQVGTIVSGQFKGANGEFKGFLVHVENKGAEIWDESHLVIIPPEALKSQPMPPA
jgi:hypothetical protein